MKINALKKLAVLITLFIISFSVISTHQDPDMWWHIRLGQEYVEQGNLQNTSTFTCTDKTWINYSLNSDIIFYHIFKVAGFSGLYIFVYLIYILGIFITYGVLRKYLGREPDFPIKIGFVLISSTFLNIFFSVRPHIFSYLYVTLVMLFFSYKVNRQFSSKEILILSGISLIFANLHSGFFMGYAVIGLYLLANIVTEFINYYKNPLKENLVVLVNLFKNYLILGVLLTAVSFVNYWGIGLWQEIIVQLTSTQNQSISEWHSINLKNLFFFIYFFACAIVIYFRNILGKNQTLLFIFIPLTLLSFQSIRGVLNNIPIFTVLLFIIVQSGYSKLSSELNEIFKNKSFRILGTIYGFIILFVLFSVSLNKLAHDIASIQNFEIEETKSEYPRNALKFIQENLADKTFFNNYGWGGYLTFKAPEIKWFIDGRMPAWQCSGNYINNEIMEDYLEVENLKSNWMSVLKHWNIDAILVKNDSKLANALSELPSWQLAYKDSIAVVFKKI